MAEKLTDAQRRALEIVQSNPGISAAEFARKMWPESHGWNTRRKCGGYGVHKGGGMYVAAGQYLGKLHRAGLVKRSFGTIPPSTYITPAGRAALGDQP